MVLGGDAIGELLGATAECTSRGEYEAARLEWLERAVGVDATYFGAAGPERAIAPVVSGVSTDRVQRCEALSERYWRDRLALQRAALKSGGVVADHDALSVEQRDKMPFYREVVAGHGIRATAVGMLQLRGEVLGSMFLGRASRGARFGDELGLLRRALPVLSLGEVAHEAALPGGVQTPNRFALTRREQEVLRLICRGWTNAKIASWLGSSPLTVKNQVSAILSKTKTANRTQLVSHATRSSRRPI